MDAWQVVQFAGHSRADMSLLYELEDRDAQERTVVEYQRRILGTGEGGVQ